MTAGLSSTSFCRIASACAELGLRLRWLARLRQQVAEVSWCPPVGPESGDGGIVIGQLLRIASASRISASASDGLPVFDSMMPRSRGSIRQVAAEFGDGGVVVGQLLMDRQRLCGLGLRLRWLARIRQQVSRG